MAGPPTPADMSKCDPKCRCTIASFNQIAFACDDPCRGQGNCKFDCINGCTCSGCVFVNVTVDYVAGAGCDQNPPTFTKTCNLFRGVGVQASLEGFIYPDNCGIGARGARIKIAYQTACIGSDPVEPPQPGSFSADCSVFSADLIPVSATVWIRDPIDDTITTIAGGSL